MPNKIFLAHSGRTNKLGTAVTRYLGAGLDVNPWSFAFQPGETTFDTLLRNAREYDFGVFAFLPEDFKKVEDRYFLNPNVLFELGVFAGAKGGKRAFLIIPQDCGGALPADLEGVTRLSYDPRELTSQNQSSIITTCAEIRTQIDALSCTECHFLQNRATGLCLDVWDFREDDGAPVCQYAYHGGPNQLWSVEMLDQGWVKITSKNSGKCLQVKDGSQEENAPVEQGGYTGEPHQQWSLKTFGGNTYQIKARHSGRFLTVTGLDKGALAVQRAWANPNEIFLWWLADAITI